MAHQSSDDDDDDVGWLTIDDVDHRQCCYCRERMQSSVVKYHVINVQNCSLYIHTLTASEVYYSLTQISTTRLPPASPKPATRSVDWRNVTLWDDHGIRRNTKVAVYKAAILTSLQYGAESWILYRRHIRKLEQFHMRCLRRIARQMARQEEAEYGSSGDLWNNSHWGLSSDRTVPMDRACCTNERRQVT